MFCLVTAAASATPVGIPTDQALGFQQAASPVMERITGFHNMMLWIITAISLVVLALLVYVVFRFREKANPNPSKNSHNTLLEVVWTAIPVLILVIIAVPSFRLLYFQDVLPETDFTIKTTGWQWNWEYEYVDHGGFSFFSNMTLDADIDNEPYTEYRNLSTDLPIVVPVGATVRVEVTAADVIHNWAMPSFGIKMDAIPGRLNETWFQTDIEGIYYGQCSELCGVRHAFMPIELHVVPQDVFDAWVEASNEDPYSGPDVLAAYYESTRESRVAAAQ
ncbi:cytochrome c oxidase subunit II [Maricaulaceae bacterium EIL42A08]|nr:cytochrome c oxidase subunit II [Maricaulaceae bacterium EIL42A08]